QTRVNFSILRFKGEARFIETKFLAKQEDNKIIENNFREAIFENKVSFNRANFKARVNFSISRFKGEARFIKAQFLAKQEDNKIIENNFREAIFENKVSFGGAIFQARVNFSISKFKDEVRFIDTVFKDNDFIFKNVEFYHAEFISSEKEDIESDQEQKYHFKNVIFKDVTSFENLNISELNFENVIFNNIVVFKDVNFVLNDKSKINKPNFINCTFSNQFNIEHKYIQYDFDEIKAKINSDTEKNYKDLLNYRDLFRKLKSNRIAHHNQIDASELRTQELYARELELKYKKDKSLKEKIERWQLIFYHQLCDHHTDLILNLKWLIIVIGLFASLYFILQVIQNFDIFLALNKYGLILSLIGFILITIVYYFQDIKKFDFFACVASILVLNVICYKPKLIFGIANLIGDNTHNGFENFLFTVYTIIIGLVVFSLQKTARKNSIVPS
ncbi:pentapeptide repeat-containing protein, partial [Campylobacter sp. 2457A]|uniref:pentapeptide repeat-containing protein n=1 Tax=Campylobacter sp. 2457A TaxID=2735784 RepID=UPI00301C90C6|nr:pentapeptide repeat-containing protein [Campylobacter sp. 2457A]